MKEWLIDNGIALLLALFGGTAFYKFIDEKILRKRKEKKEAIKEKIEQNKGKEKEEERQMKLSSDALLSMQTAYNKFTSDSIERYHILTVEIGELKHKLLEISRELNKEKIKYQKLKVSYDNLKREFDCYKLNHNTK